MPWRSTGRASAAHCVGKCWRPQRRRWRRVRATRRWRPPPLGACASASPPTAGEQQYLTLGSVCLCFLRQRTSLLSRRFPLFDDVLLQISWAATDKASRQCCFRSSVHLCCSASYRLQGYYPHDHAFDTGWKTLRRAGRDDVSKQLMVESLLDDLAGYLANGADDADAAAQAGAIGSILAAVRRN